MRAFFRYLRGELLNGFYIRALNLLAEKLPSFNDLKVEMTYWLNLVFDSTIMRFSDLKGIAQIAGVINQKGLSGFIVGLFRLSESNVVAGFEYSDRGLLNQTDMMFNYFWTDQNPHIPDLTTLTSLIPPILRSPLVPFALQSDGTPLLDANLQPVPPTPLGYLWGDASTTINIDSNGFVIPEMVHPAQPPMVNDLVNNIFVPAQYAWSPWFGDDYLPLAENYPLEVQFGPDLLYKMLVIHQKIKYNGLGLYYLLELTDEIVSDLISNINISINVDNEFGTAVYYYFMTFDFNKSNIGNDDGWGRLAVWEHFIRSKFPYISYNLEIALG